MKEFKSRHGADLYKGTDARDHKVMMEKKKQKMMQKVRDEALKNKKEKKGPGNRSFGDKAMAKIQERSRPTRSKMIIKSGSGKKSGVQSGGRKHTGGRPGQGKR